MTLNLFYFVVSVRSYCWMENMCDATFPNRASGDTRIQTMQSNWPETQDSWHFAVYLFYWFFTSFAWQKIFQQCKQLVYSIWRFTIPIKITDTIIICLQSLPVSAHFHFVCKYLCATTNTFLSWNNVSSDYLYQNSSTWNGTTLQKDNGCITIWPRTNTIENARSCLFLYLHRKSYRELAFF